MSAADRLDEIEARANAATGGPWGVYDGAESILTEHDCTGDCEDFHPILVRNQVDGVPLPSVWSTPEDAVFIAQARTDVPALVAALRAVLDLHREARNDVDRTPPCPHCHGEPGVHECGCWADEKWPTVCAVCMEGTKGASVEYPCATVRAIEEALS